MKYQEALIAWTPDTDLIRVGHLLRSSRERDWTDYLTRYENTGGAAEVWLRQCENKYHRDMMLFIEFNTIVVRDNVPVATAHREFLKIDEYRERISPDSPGLPSTGGC